MSCETCDQLRKALERLRRMYKQRGKELDAITRLLPGYGETDYGSGAGAGDSRPDVQRTATGVCPPAEEESAAAAANPEPGERCACAGCTQRATVWCGDEHMCGHHARMSRAYRKQQPDERCYPIRKRGHEWMPDGDSWVKCRRCGDRYPSCGDLVPMPECARKQQPDERRCGCGCGFEPTYTVTGTERGVPYVEHCCESAARYLEECAGLYDDQYRREPYQPRPTEEPND